MKGALKERAKNPRSVARHYVRTEENTKECCKQALKRAYLLVGPEEGISYVVESLKRAQGRLGSIPKEGALSS